MIENDPTIELAVKLISVSSISPDQSETQEIIADRLSNMGFAVQRIELNGCNNLWARLGTKSPLFVFSGHTDVVSTGELNRWTTPPFDPVIRDAKIYGRGAADMKGAIASMVTAVEAFLKESPTEPSFSIGFLITGDEETGGRGARDLLDHLYAHNQKIDYCLVGEPTSESCLGDTIKIGRRGSLNATLKIFGRQGHVGYPHLAENALHVSLEPLTALINTTWDNGGEFFQPTTFQIVDMKGGIASNIIPGEATIAFNFRFSIYSTPESIKRQVEAVLNQFKDLSYELSWKVDIEPFITKPGILTEVVTNTIKEILSMTPAASTGGGSSDARFFAKKGVQVVELGPLNESIHQYDENISGNDLISLSNLYKKILLNFGRMQ